MNCSNQVRRQNLHTLSIELSKQRPSRLTSEGRLGHANASHQASLPRERQVLGSHHHFTPDNCCGNLICHPMTHKREENLKEFKEGAKVTWGNKQKEKLKPGLCSVCSANIMLGQKCRPRKAWLGYRDKRNPSLRGLQSSAFSMIFSPPSFSLLWPSLSSTSSFFSKPSGTPALHLAGKGRGAPTLTADHSPKVCKKTLTTGSSWRIKQLLYSGHCTPLKQDPHRENSE